MDCDKAIKITKGYLKTADVAGYKEQSAYYSKVLDALYRLNREEKVSLITQINENGYKTIEIVPMERCDTIHGVIMHHISDVLRRFGNRYANHVSSYFYGKEDLGCRNCYHRAEYIVHGLLTGFFFGTVFLMILVWLVLHRG